MQVTEKSSEGLKRTLQVVIGAGELNQRFDERLGEIKDRVQLKGFRKGKVPATHLKKVYGRSVMLEVVDEAVRDTSSKALTERKERPAHQPAISLPEDKDEIERVLSGEADLSYEMSFEVLPQIEVADLSQLKLERLTADVDDDAIDKALDEIAARSTAYEAAEGRVAENGDRLTIDFVGKLDGVPFEGGTGQGIFVVLGQGSFIPGFEEGLAGAKAGDERVVTATFPEDYSVESLAGKQATFDVVVKEVAVPKKPPIDDEFAKSLGVESLAKLRELIKAQIAGNYAGLARLKLKRELLDALEKAHDFELPATLVDGEFNAIWHDYMHNLEHAKKTLADEGKTEEEARAEYRKIAERRVRLGLLIGEIGEQNKIEVSHDELRQALMEQARRYPGQEKAVYEHYQKTPGALAQLRAPIFEEKVVDFVIEQVKPSEKKVTREELFKEAEAATEAEAPHHHHHHHDHDHHHDHGHDHHHHDHDHDHDHHHHHDHDR